MSDRLEKAIKNLADAIRAEVGGKGGGGGGKPSEFADAEPTGVEFPFGRDKGMDMAHVSTDSLKWALENRWDSEALKDRKWGKRNASQRAVALAVLAARGVGGSTAPGKPAKAAPESTAEDHPEACDCSMCLPPF